MDSTESNLAGIIHKSAFLRKNSMLSEIESKSEHSRSVFSHSHSHTFFLSRKINVLLVFVFKELTDFITSTKSFKYLDENKFDFSLI